MSSITNVGSYVKVLTKMNNVVDYINIITSLPKLGLPNFISLKQSFQFGSLLIFNHTFL